MIPIIGVSAFIGLIIHIVAFILAKIQRKSTQRLLRRIVICFMVLCSMIYVDSLQDSHSLSADTQEVEPIPNNVENEKQEEVATEISAPKELQTEEMDELIIADKVAEDSDLEKSETATNNISALDEFYLALTPGISKKDVESLAKSYGLYSSSKNNGVGIVTYRFAETRDVASHFQSEKGNYVTVSYSALDNDSFRGITYFNMDKMIEARGNQLIDYNNPQEPSISVESAIDVVEFEPTKPDSYNLLEKLFISVTPDTTEDEIIAYAQENGLYYDSRGKGNQQLIAYSSDITKKFGDDGTYVAFSCDKYGLEYITYYDYPTYYKDDYYASYYSDHTASLYKLDGRGYYLSRKAKYDDAVSLIEEIRSKR